MQLTQRQLTSIRELLTHAPLTSKLTSWERGFIRNMQLRIDKYGITHDTTPYQFQVMHEIGAKVFDKTWRI